MIQRESNLPEIGRLFPRNAVAVITFAFGKKHRHPPGNPKGIKAIEDLARRDVAIVNREKARQPGSSGFCAEAPQIDSKNIRGYDRIAPATCQPLAGAVRSSRLLHRQRAARVFGWVSFRSSANGTISPFAASTRHASIQPCSIR